MSQIQPSKHLASGFIHLLEILRELRIALLELLLAPELLLEITHVVLCPGPVFADGGRSEESLEVALYFFKVLLHFYYNQFFLLVWWSKNTT